MGFLWFKPDVEKLRRKRDAWGLVKALWEEDLRDEATVALGSLGEPALPAMLARLAEDTSFPFDEELVKATAMVGPPAVGPLLALVERGPDPGRRRALRALGLVGDRTALAPVLVTYLGATQLVKATALKALVQIAGSEHFEIVLKALTDPDGAVRQQAAESLGDLGDPRASPSLKSLWLLVRALDIETADDESIAGVLGRHGRQPEDPGVRLMLLAWHRGEMMMTLSGSLAKLGDADANGFLLDALKSGKSPLLRRDAAIQLGRVGGPTAVAALAGAFGDPEADVRVRAIAALAEIGGSEARRILVKMKPTATLEDQKRIEKALKTNA